ncbi:MAG: tetratricopeptide repeat protein [Bacteroidota bacterium]
MSSLFSLYTKVSVVAILLIFTSCSIQKKSGTASEETPAQKPVSDIKKLESTAILIDASKQKMLENWSNAIVLYAEAIKADPENDAALFELAKIHASQGQLNDAEKFAKKAVELEPDNNFYKLSLADIYFLQKKNEEGIRIQKELADASPNNINLQLTLLSSYFYIEDYENALAQIQHIEDISGFSNELSIEKQKLFVELGQIENAIKEAEKLLSYYPQDVLYMETLADLYIQADREEDAFELYQKMLEIQPDYAMARLLLADYYRNKGMEDESFDQIKKAFQSEQLKVEAKVRILLTYFFMGEENIQHRNHADTLIQMLLDQHPENHTVLAVYGDFLMQEEKLQEARKYLYKAAQTEPGEINYWQQVLFIDSQTENFEQMLEVSNEALEYFFEQPVLYFFNGLANFQLKMYEQAINSLQYGKELSTSDDELYGQFLTLLADSYYKTRNLEMAFQYYEETIQLQPDNAYALNNYGYYLSLNKMELDKAYEMSKKAVNMEPDNAAFLDTYGWINYLLGNYEKALEYIKESIEIADEPSAVVYEHYGDVLYKLGDREEAFLYWDKALKTAGEDRDEVSEFLEEKVKQKTLIE